MPNWNISPQPAYIPISRYAKTHRRCTASPHARNARFSGCWSASRVSGETQLAWILSTYSPAELANILATENAVLLKNVKGLGLKTAQKIIVELKDKAAGLGSTGTGSPAQTAAAGTDETRTEATAALTMLGFGKAASEKPYNPF